MFHFRIDSIRHGGSLGGLHVPRTAVGRRCSPPASSRLRLGADASLCPRLGRPLLTPSPLLPFTAEAALTSAGPGTRSRSWKVSLQPSTPVWTRGKPRTSVWCDLVASLRVSGLPLTSIFVKLPRLSDISRCFCTTEERFCRWRRGSQPRASPASPAQLLLGLLAPASVLSSCLAPRQAGEGNCWEPLREGAHDPKRLTVLGVDISRVCMLYIYILKLYICLICLI